MKRETKVILRGKELKGFQLVEFSTHDDWEATRYTIEGFVQRPLPKPKKVAKTKPLKKKAKK